MEKLGAGVYRLRLGQPEELTPVRYKEYPMKEVGGDYPFPFSEASVEWKPTSRGLLVSLPLEGQVFGFGLQLKGFNHTRQRRVMRNNADAPSDSGESHAPVPFYVTTAGYGVYVDSAREIAFHCGQAKDKGESRGKGAVSLCNLLTAQEEYDRYVRSDSPRMVIDVPIAKGVDLYVFAGSSLREAVQKYNMFSGGGANPPAWGLGAWYRMYHAARAEQWVGLAKRFKEEDIPVSVIGLEPGCYTQAYSCSYLYDEERIGDAHTAIEELREMGYRVNLWQHGYTHPDAPIYDKLLPYSGDFEVWGGLVPDLSLPEARDIFAEQMTALGVDCFKLDECDGSDHTGGWSFPDGASFPSGLDGEQMHHLMGMLYQQTVNHAFPGAYHSVRASGALAAPYPFVLYSDLYEHKDFVRGVVNAGFSGLLWAPEVRHAENGKDLIRRLQTALFSPQMLVNAWYLPNPPWDQIDRALNEQGVRMEDAETMAQTVRELFRMRQKMIPYLQTQFRRYQEEGIPVFRALVMDYPRDQETWAIDDAYLVGDRYLFAPLTAEENERRVYLPGGRWTRGDKCYEPGWHTLQASIEEYLLFEKEESPC